MDFCHFTFAFTAAIEEHCQMADQLEGSRPLISQIAILHIPHASRFVPVEERQAIRLNDVALSYELLHMTDAYTDELFPVTPVEAARVHFPVSRLVCDVERFPSDEDEQMAARGMGAIYTRTSMGEVLRAEPDTAQRQTLLNRWYWPHHARLERVVNDVIARSGVCLIVDCHSFSSVPLPHEPDQNARRPDFCIGTDSFHTPADVRDVILSAIKDEDYSVAVDTPFAGALVPPRSYRKDSRVSSVMIEVNRLLYMDEQSSAKSPHFEKVSNLLGRLVTVAAEAAATLATKVSEPHS
jgi:N-formylglutamate deformylase